MGRDSEDQRDIPCEAGDFSEAQLLDAATIEKTCADLCAKLGRNVPACTAPLKVFGVMASRAETINFMEFNLGHADADLSTIPLPFVIDKNQEVMLLENFNQKAVRTSYAGAVSLFNCFKVSDEASILVAASDLEWAIVVNEDGGVVYWQDKSSNPTHA